MTRAPRSAGMRMLLVLLVLAVVAGACGDDEATDKATPTTDGSEIRTVTPGKLTTCTDVPYAPFEFEENGRFTGIDVELVRAVAKELSLEAEFKDLDFEAIFSALNSGQCDIVASSVTITDERKESLDFSDGYFQINQSLLVRKGDEAKYDELDKLAGRSIGVQSETTGAAFAKENAKGATVREFTGADDAFTALKAGQVDGVLQDLPVNAYHAETTGETVVAKTFTEGEKEEYGFAMRKGSAQLKKAIDEALEKVKEDGTFDEILRRFLGETTGQT